MTTLGTLRYDLATRLGFTTQGDVSQRQRLILDSFIRTAQYVLYQDLPAHLFYKTANLPIFLMILQKLTGRPISPKCIRFGEASCLEKKVSSEIP